MDERTLKKYFEEQRRAALRLNDTKLYMDITKKMSSTLVHSAKGSEWVNHKYIKRVNGTYYYPDSYEGGRHISDLKEGSAGAEKNDRDEKEEPIDWDGELSENDVEKLALEVIRGNFGNGQQRRELLGDNYSKIQSRVNELMRTGEYKNKKSSSSESEEKEESTEKTTEKEEKKTTSSKTKNFDPSVVFRSSAKSTKQATQKSDDDEKKKKKTSSGGGGGRRISYSESR